MKRIILYKTLLLFAILFSAISTISASNITQIKYYIDGDVGNTTTHNITPTTNLDSLITITPASLTQGFHQLSVFVVDNNGNRSLTQNTPFYYLFANSTSNKLSKVEFVVDETHTQTFDITPTDQLDEVFMLNTDSISVGMHLLKVFVYSDAGNKSLTNYISFIMHQGTAISNKINAFEVYFDNDTASTQTISVAATQVYNGDLPIDIATLPIGQHTITITAIAENGLPSIQNTGSFMKLNGTNTDSIIALEYFFDTEPSVGNGTPIAINPTSSLDTLVEFTVPNNLSVGMHKFYIRAKSNAGEWSLYQWDSIRICSVLPPIAGFQSIRYGNAMSFIDTSHYATNWSWSFGDGNTNNLRFPIHNYAFGNFNIQQIVSNACDADTAYGEILIDGVESFTPNSAGVNGDVIMTIYGGGLSTTTTVVITDGTTTYTPVWKKSNEGSQLTAYFDLHNATTGTYDVVITVNGTTYNYPNSFTIEEYVKPSFISEIISPSVIRANSWQNVTMQITNTGNVLANGVISSFIVPQDFEVEPLFEIYKSTHLDTFTRYGQTHVLPYDSIFKNWDTAYVLIDSMNGEPYAGKAYTYWIPFIQPNSDVTYSFKVKSQTIASTKMYVNTANATMFGSAMPCETDDFYDGLFAAGITILDNTTDPAIGDYIEGAKDLVGSAAYATGLAAYDWWNGTNSFDDPGVAQDFLKESDAAMIREQAARNKLYNEVKKKATEEGVKYLLNKVLKTDKLAKLTESGYRKVLQNETGRKVIMKIRDEFYPDKPLREVMDMMFKDKIVDAISGQAADLVGDDDADAATADPCPPDGNGFNLPNDPDEQPVRVRTSRDPNAIYGPIGFNENYISSNQTFKYIITFENVDTADLPAQTVIVKNQLDTNLLDVNTLSLGIVHIGNKYARMKSYRKEYFTEIDLRPEKNMLVRINAALDTTGTITWTFLSIDPTTGDFITDALDGFLPPNTNPPIGEGIVSYSIAPKNNIQTNDIINNKALIYFDTNDPIETNTWTNIIDDEAPIVNLSVEQVNTTDSLMKVTLVGNDLKSGFRYFDIYYKKNNHSYKYLIRSTAGEFTMKGDVDSTYSFYAIGYDSTKNNKIYSTEESITLNELSTAINTSLVEKGIALYPNPTNGILQVAFSKPLVGKLEYIITTIEGKMIQQKVLQEQNNFFLDLTQQTNGLYFIQFKQNNEILGTAKIIKQ